MKRHLWALGRIPRKYARRCGWCRHFGSPADRIRAASGAAITDGICSDCQLTHFGFIAADEDYSEPPEVA